MASNTEQVQEFTVSELLSGSGMYTIPVYQRNYAWEERQIRQLIKDIIDSLNNNNTKKYYIGTLIVDKTEVGNEKLLETIDGQQRLTTLNIISIVLKNHPDFKEIDTKWFERLNLSFSNRQKSEITLIDLFNDSIIEEARDYNSTITFAYDLVASILKEELKENSVALKEFTSYLFEYVTILRVEVPPQTDLNHYFEIMNNRGEQLEKHEVLKARLLDSFNLIEDKALAEDYKHVFHTVWEACANMEKYVQYGFPVNVRHKIFDENSWDNFHPKDFESLKKSFPQFNTQNEDAKSIDEIINDTRKNRENNDGNDEKPERFYSIINFSNFLLHVLRVFTKEDIPLDDKRLLSTFDNYIKSLETTDEKISFSKDFGFSLLKAKYLFDKFIIKRDTSKDREEWSLLKMKNSTQKKGRNSYTASYPNSFEDTSENKKLVQLLSMFHVSLPTMSYKHWLNASLNYVCDHPNTSAKEYANFLENTAKHFVFNRIVAKSPQEYYDLIYKPKNRNEIIWSDDNTSTIDKSKFSFGQITNNLLFNYLDYQLWKEELSKDKSISKIIDFKFTSRSSVEHYYPQNPKEGYPRLKDSSTLNCFGNLCLISHSKNSTLSNFSPLNKAEFYLKGEIDSIKQYLMIQNAKDWNESLILEHNAEILQLLKNTANGNQ
ncbi:DUF262 domain-containing protein [Cellulophaga baltica]|uniref:DUF262 domain-containing protein n=1 Tax=Cellulophaga baltica TaxID=76594 RepID=UPI0015F472B8|nr:DUF262 domain-containing protein [Cellulophaga baltica]MBA6315172.1 DUF262 domain-containing protein [Cellulophaga baltica]